MKNKYDINNRANNFKKYENVKSQLIMDNCGDFSPEVSITIPTFKRPLLLKETIDSVVNQITSVKFEIIVVDNDSDGEFDKEIINLIRSYTNSRIKYYRNEENIGMFGNWNRCIELSNAPWFSILNDDDLLHPKFIQKAFDSLEEQPELKMVTTTPIRFRDKKDLEGISRVVDYFSIISNEIMLSGHFTNGTLGSVYNRGIALQLGGFDEDIYPISDYFFAFKYIYHNKSAIIDKNLAYARWMENESMKMEVVKSFIREDYVMWNDIISFLYKEKSITLLEKKLLAYRARNQTILKVPKYQHLLEKSDNEDFGINEFLEVKDIEKKANYFLPKLVINLSRLFFGNYARKLQGIRSKYSVSH